MIVDKKYCSSSFLMYRTIADENRCFQEGLKPSLYRPEKELHPVHNSDELEACLRDCVERTCRESKAAIALSGGIDSAVLAKFMPKGSIAYTFKCVVPGIQVTDETPAAARYAKECGLEHRIVEVYWEDFERYAPILMRHKGAPMHSIEVQIYKAALRAKADGCEAFIFGESADLNYGGLSGLMSKDWRMGEFIDRYSYVKPYHALREFEIITEPLFEYERDGFFDAHEFCRGFFLREAMGSYINACKCAGIPLEMPYIHTKLAVPIDYQRIRAGENKYVVRELFQKLYPEMDIPAKLPMPRPMNEWMQAWNGPTRPEFWPHCTDNMNGDQKWLVWALERFLNLLEE